MSKKKDTSGQESISIKKYLKDIRKEEILSGEEQKRLAELAKNGDQESMDKLLRCNLRFILSIARQYLNYGLELEDLISEGSIGLIRAVKKYDSERNIKFISYAVWWIRQSIVQSIYENGNTIRLPVNRINEITKINKARESLAKKLQREPTINELSKATNLSCEDVAFFKNEIILPSSLEESVGEESDMSLIDVIPSEEFTNPIDSMSYNSLKDRIDEILSELSVREKEIIERYYGLSGFEKHTLKEIGDVLKLTNERIRQIKDDAEKKLRCFKVISKLKEFLNEE